MLRLLSLASLVCCLLLATPLFAQAAGEVCDEENGLPLACQGDDLLRCENGIVALFDCDDAALLSRCKDTGTLIFCGVRRGNSCSDGEGSLFFCLEDSDDCVFERGVYSCVRGETCIADERQCVGSIAATDCLDIGTGDNHFWGVECDEYSLPCEDGVCVGAQEGERCSDGLVACADGFACEDNVCVVKEEVDIDVPDAGPVDAGVDAPPEESKCSSQRVLASGAGWSLLAFAPMFWLMFWRRRRCSLR